MQEIVNASMCDVRQIFKNIYFEILKLLILMLPMLIIILMIITH